MRSSSSRSSARGPAPDGGDTLTAATIISRLNTAGDVAPATGCAVAADVGARAFVPYTADHFFYRGSAQQAGTTMRSTAIRSRRAALAALALAACGGYQGGGADQPGGAPPAGAAAPRVLAFDVRGSPPPGGGLLAVSGTGIGGTTQVTFGGVPATIVDFTEGRQRR